MTCGIWKRSLPPSGFIILPQPGKPWGCSLLCGPLARSPATGGEQGEGMRHWVAMPWTLAVSGSFCSEGSCFLFDVPALPGALIFLLPQSKRSYRDVLLGKLCGVHRAGFGFRLPPPAHCSLSVPFESEPALVVPSLCMVSEGKRSSSLFYLSKFLARLTGKCLSMLVVTAT